MNPSLIYYLQYSRKMKLFNELTVRKQIELISQDFPDAEQTFQYREILVGKSPNRPNLIKAIEKARNEKCIIAMATLAPFKYNPEHLYEIYHSEIPLWVSDIGFIHSGTLKVLIKQLMKEKGQQRAVHRNAFEKRKESKGEWRNGRKVDGELCLGQKERRKAEARIKHKARTNIYTRRLWEEIPNLSLYRGLYSLKDMALSCTMKGHRSPRGKAVSAMQLSRLFNRYDKEQLGIK